MGFPLPLAPETCLSEKGLHVTQEPETTFTQTFWHMSNPVLRNEYVEDDRSRLTRQRGGVSGDGTGVSAPEASGPSVPHRRQLRRRQSACCSP